MKLFGTEEFRAWAAAPGDFLRFMTRLVSLRKPRITISTLIPFAFLTTRKQKKPAAVRFLSGKNGWKLAIIQKMSGAFRGCMQFILNGKIIRRKSPLKLLSE